MIQNKVLKLFKEVKKYFPDLRLQDTDYGFILFYKKNEIMHIYGMEENKNTLAHALFTGILLGRSLEI
jgi:hypothetical protein